MPAVVSGALVGWQPPVGAEPRRIIGIDTQSGQVLFQGEPAESYDLKPLLTAGDCAIALTSAYDGLRHHVELTSYALPTGRKVWSRAVEGSPDLALHARGALLLVAERKRLLRLEPATGATRWQVALPDEVVSLTSLADRIYAQVDDGTVVVLEAPTGRVLLSRPIDSLSYRGWTTLTGSLTASTQALFLDTDEGVLVLDAELRERNLIGDLHRPFAEGDVVIATYGSDFTYRLDPANGHVLWRHASDIWSDAPTLTPTTVLLGGDDLIIALDAATGRERWRWTYPHARD